MGSQKQSGKVAPTHRRYTRGDREQAVRLVRLARREERGHGAVRRVGDQLGIGVESMRAWVKQADINEGLTGGTTTADAARLKDLEAEVRELRRANEILKRASVFWLLTFWRGVYTRLGGASDFSGV